MSSEPLYPAYLPTRSDGYIKPVEVPLFEADEPGRRANPDKPSLLKGATATNITPRIGTEIRGVQISQLSNEGLDELALLAAERGVVVFVRVPSTIVSNSAKTREIERPGFCGCWL